jgi:uncharacterized membrane protein YgcG
VIRWSVGADGALTALGDHNEQLVVRRYQPRHVTGTDPRDAVTGSMTAAGSAPSAGGLPSAGDKSIGEGGTSSPRDVVPAGTAEAVEVRSRGLEFAYSTVGQGDPYLVTRYLMVLEDQLAYLHVAGLLGTVTMRMTVGGDQAHVPTVLSAKYGRHTLDWTGLLDLGESPYKALARVPGWRFQVFEQEAASAAFFDVLSPVVVDLFGDMTVLGPDEIAESWWAPFGRAAAWCAGGAVPAAKFTPAGPQKVWIVIGACAGGAGASFVSDLITWLGADDVPVDPPPNPEPTGTDPEEPDPADGCFAAGTLVAGVDGLVTIETIELGALVSSRDEHSEVSAPGKVREVWAHPEKRTLDVRLDSGEVIRTTRPHRFFTENRGIVPAAELRAGDRLATLTDEARTVIEVFPGPDGITVYNLTVDHAHTYFVGKAGVWVHNEKKTTTNDPPPPDDGSGTDSGGSTDGSGGGSTTDGSSGGGSGGGGSPTGGSSGGGGSAPPPA